MKCSQESGDEEKLNKTFQMLQGYILELADVPYSLNNLEFTQFEKMETLLADFEIKVVDLGKKLSDSFNENLSK